MNKKVLSAILFSALFAGTGTFTSCIDTDEPAGIEELRGAKAELIRAKVAVEEANAAKILAQAELVKAKAANQLAEAKINEAKAKIQEAKAEFEAAKTAEEKARVEASIAKYEQQILEDVLTHQKNMVNLNKALAKAQNSYELALAKIAVAKELCPFDATFELSSLEDAVGDWTDEVARLTAKVDSIQGEYSKAALDYEYFGKIDADSLQFTLDTLNVKLVAAQSELAKYENWLTEDVKTKDWRAEVDELIAATDSLGKLKADYTLNYKLALNSTEYKALQEAVEAALIPATVDSVYGYKYFGDEYATTLYGEEATTPADTATYLSNGTAEVTEKAAKLAQVEAALDSIAQYDNDGTLIGGKLYADKKYLASFTAEAKHFLDSVAAMKADADTVFEAEAKKAIKAWEDALAKYAKADTTMKALADTAAKYYYSDWDETSKTGSTKRVFANANSMKDFAKAMYDYLEVAQKNGAELNKVLAFDDSIKRPAIVGGAIAYKDSAAYSMQNVLDVLKDTVKTYSAYKEFQVDFYLPAPESGTKTKDFTVLDKATEAKKKFTNNLFAIKTAAPDTDELYNNLVWASKNAFGEASLYYTLGSAYTHGDTGYLHVQPDSADVMNIIFFNGFDNDEIHADLIENVSNGVVGAYGKFLVAKNDDVKAFANNYKAIMTDLEAAIAYWEATYKTLNAKFTAWEDTLDAAVKAQDDYEEANINNLGEKKAELQAEITRLNKIKKALQDAIEVYLPQMLDGNKYGEQAFYNSLNEVIASQRATVLSLTKQVAAAKKAVELNDCGSYNKVAAEQLALDVAMAELENAQAELDKALANVAKALEIYQSIIAE